MRLADLNGDGKLDIVLDQLTETAILTPVSIVGTGTHNVTVTYGGKTSFTGSTLSPIQLTASLIAATVTLTPEPGATYPYHPGGSIAVAVTSTAGTNTPTGIVSYTINGGAANVAQLSTSGTVTLSLGLLAPGPYTIVVNYSGDSIHATATGMTAITVTKSNQAITFAPIANMAYGGIPSEFRRRHMPPGCQ